VNARTEGALRARIADLEERLADERDTVRLYSEQMAKLGCEIAHLRSRGIRAWLSSLFLRRATRERASTIVAALLLAATFGTLLAVALEPQNFFSHDHAVESGKDAHP